MLHEQEPNEQQPQLTNEQKAEIKHDRMRLEQILTEDGVKRVPPGPHKFLCPYHNDRNPSAEIKERPTGYYFICYACDLDLDYFALMARRENKSLRKIFNETARDLNSVVNHLFSQPSPQQESNGTIEELASKYLSSHPNYALERIYKYDDPDTGGCVFATVRYLMPGGGKTVLQATFTSQTGWQFKSLPNNRPLYNLTKVRQSQNVLVVEGEKCVDRFTELNMPNWAATTSPGGGKAPELTDWSPLTGKNVVVWRDHDRPGRRYQNTVIELIRKIATEIKVVNPEMIGGWEPNEKDDIVDFLDSVRSVDPVPRLESIFRSANVWTPSLDFQEHLQDIRAGRYELIEIPGMPMLTQVTQMTLPGKSTLLVGNPGSAKSFMAMQLGWTLNEASVPTAVVFLEDGKVDYQKRCIAQMSGHQEYTDGKWQQEYPDEAEEIFRSMRCRLDSFFEHVTCVEAKLMTPAWTLQWLESAAKAGYRVAIIDPVTAMEMASKQWESDHKFVLAAQNLINDYGMSLIATTHQKAGVKKPGTEGAAGGQAWHRFTHTNLWMMHNETTKGPTYSRVLKPTDAQDVVQHKRTLMVTKARNGPGTGRTLAIDLDPTTLRIVEHGLVLEKLERQPGRANDINGVEPDF